LRDIDLDERVIEWLEMSVEKSFGNGLTEKMVVASFLRAMVNINKQASTVKRLLNRVVGIMTAQDDLEAKMMEALHRYVR
jgi:hypothetical protein